MQGRMGSFLSCPQLGEKSPFVFCFARQVSSARGRPARGGPRAPARLRGVESERVRLSLKQTRSHDVFKLGTERTGRRGGKNKRVDRRDSCAADQMDSLNTQTANNIDSLLLLLYWIAAYPFIHSNEEGNNNGLGSPL